MKKITAKKVLCIIVIVMLLSFIGQNLILTNGGNVKVENVKWETEEGAYLNSTLYVPKGVTADNPAPAVVACHGYNNTAGDMENHSIELARRGYVVIAIDLLGHGSSTHAVGLTTNDDMADGTEDQTVGLDYEGDALVKDGGVYDALQYLGSLPFVDKDNIGLLGHSAGGMAVQFGGLRALVNHENDQTVTTPKAILVACEGADADFNPFPVNVATFTPQFDEFVSGHWNVENSKDAVSSPKMKKFFGFSEQSPDLQFNQFYIKGQEETISEEEAIEAAAKGDLMIPYFINGSDHPGVNYSKLAISDMLSFFNITLQGGEDTLDTNNQIWLFKNILGLICMLGFFLIMIPVSFLLIETKLFSSLKSQPYSGAVLSGSKLKYWLMLIPGIILTAVLYYPLMGNPIVDKFQGWINPLLWPSSKAFPMPVVNSLSLFMICMSVVTLILLGIYFRGTKEFNKSGMETVKASFSIKNIAKALLFAFIVLMISYLTLVIAQYFFHLDFRFLILNIVPVSAVRWRLLLTYVIFFIIYYMINSVVLNITVAVNGRKEWINYVFCIIFNIGGIFVVRAFDQIVFTATGVRPLTNYSSLGGTSSVAYSVSLSLIFCLALNAVISRMLYKKTGNLWISGFVCALAAVFCAICNTAICSNIF